MNYINVKFTQLGRFWQPKVDFRNAESVSVVESIRQVRYLQVRPEEKLLKSCSRLSVTFTCYMNLSTLPFDQQYCFFELQTGKGANCVSVVVRVTNIIVCSSKFNSALTTWNAKYGEYCQRATNVSRPRNLQGWMLSLVWRRNRTWIRKSTVRFRCYSASSTCEVFIALYSKLIFLFNTIFL